MTDEWSFFCYRFSGFVLRDPFIQSDTSIVGRPINLAIEHSEYGIESYAINPNCEWSILNLPKEARDRYYFQRKEKIFTKQIYSIPSLTSILTPFESQEMGIPTNRTYPNQMDFKRPPGCRTVAVTNLPEKVTKEIVREIFNQCGNISSIKINPPFRQIVQEGFRQNETSSGSKISSEDKYYVRFKSMASADRAVTLSGSRIKLRKSDDPTCNETMYVHYAKDFEDMRLYSHFQQSRIQEEKHREQLVIPSLPVNYFSESESDIFLKKIRNKETFKEALCNLVTWLERYECCKANVNSFYVMFQNLHSVLLELKNEKTEYEKELDKTKQSFVKNLRAIQLNADIIERIFKVVYHQYVWNHFTEKQQDEIKSNAGNIC
ncbi:ecto-NOX disulfide-thiol exchanger 1 [Caerostris extrusa]|uniref:Ecto-NOX disulfide-thiol exchanger 1 n=1 Tax=Caerostris extrusa TaxID=172846 RepID=A0AAV4MYD4_CAEEX|nr:ecto-NOX disulfide-thiol exchanger 1 [Caerostris extrusa]